MTAAKKLTQGMSIGVFTPSEPVVGTRKLRVEEGVKILVGHGYDVSFAKNVYAHRGYMAGTAEDRIADIHELIRSDQIHALMASWGGKSCNQLLSRIDYAAIGRSRKPLLAFSDGAVLLNAITAKTNLITFYGPNVLGKLNETQHADLKLLTGEGLFRDINILGHPENVDSRAISAGRARGRLFGGNLSTFVLGMPGWKDMLAKQRGILFWESSSEPPQIIDQYLTCLRNSGVFDRLVGMVIGNFVVPEAVEFKARDPFDVIAEAVSGYRFPVIYCPTFGHASDLENPILPIGPMCELDTGTMSVRLLEPVVR